MRRFQRGLLAAAFYCLSADALMARDVEAGRAKSQMCAVCLGALSISTAPDAPHLAVQPALYTAAQLKAYRSGARKHEVMAVMARMLSEGDISNLAAWYASLQVEVLPPR